MIGHVLVPSVLDSFCVRQLQTVMIGTVFPLSHPRDRPSGNKSVLSEPLLTRWFVADRVSNARDNFCWQIDVGVPLNKTNMF